MEKVVKMDRDMTKVQNENLKMRVLAVRKVVFLKLRARPYLCYPILNFL